MARKSTTRPAPSARTPQPREFILAGIGAVSLGRKRLLAAYANGFQELAAVRERAQEAVVAAAASLDGQVDALRRQADRWSQQACAYRDQVEHRFGPVLSQLGLPVRKPRAKRKPAARRAARRRSA